MKEYLIEFMNNGYVDERRVWASTIEKALEYEDCEVVAVYELVKKEFIKTHKCNEMMESFKIEIKFKRWALIDKESLRFHSITYCPFCGEKL